MAVTAPTPSGGKLKLQRIVQTSGIAVFQFGIFYNVDFSFTQAIISLSAAAFVPMAISGWLRTPAISSSFGARPQPPTTLTGALRLKFSARFVGPILLDLAGIDSPVAHRHYAKILRLGFVMSLGGAGGFESTALSHAVCRYLNPEYNRLKSYFRPSARGRLYP